MSAAMPYPTSSGVLGAEGRYPLDEKVAPPLRLGGTALVPVGPLRMYACGITPYDVTHVGHASTFVWADLVASLAHLTGTDALMCRNVTDIDDVLTEAARVRGWHYDELALTQEFHFDRDMKALSVQPPAMTPHARSYIGSVVRLASALLATGAAYEQDGYVFFRGEDVPARAGWPLDAAMLASREYGDQTGVPERESAFDVAVWRPSGEDDPAWPSPWGWGRPGWHAECAAMALTCLGSSVDVLLGGSDLTFPHHAYQTAMVEAASGVRPFARSVLHVGEVRRGGEKMAKSTGNLVLVADLLTRFSPQALRLGLLNRRLDEPWECEDRVFADAESTLADLRAAAGELPGPVPVDHAVLDALTDELDVPAAIAAARAGGAEATRFLLRALKLS